MHVPLYENINFEEKECHCQKAWETMCGSRKFRRVCVCVCVCVWGGGVLPSMDLLSREPIGPERKPIYPLVIFQRESGHPHPNTLRIRLETIDSRDFVMIILASILALCLYIRAGGQLGLRGVGGSHFFFIRRLGPSIYRTPPKNISSTPKTI